MRLVLVATHEKEDERRVELAARVFVGNSWGNDLKLPTRSVLQSHATFHERDGQATVQPRDGGVLVNGVAIEGPTPVTTDDVVTMGTWTLRLELLVEPLLPPFVGRTERERELVTAVARAPADGELRQVYGDWLEENGHAAEAELIALERQLGPAAAGPLAYRLRLVAERTPLAFRALATAPPIRDCEEQACPRLWSRLTVTGNARIRDCATCKQQVWLADSVEEVRHCAARRRRFVVDRVVRPKRGDFLPPAATDSEAIGREVPFLQRLNVSDAATLYADLGVASPVAEEPLTPYIQRMDVTQCPDGTVTAFRIDFRANHDAILELLRRRYGPSANEVVAPDGRVYWREGNFLIRRHGGWTNGCTLAWEMSPPEWMGERGGNVPSTLAYLHTVAAALRSGATRDAVLEVISRPPFDACFTRLGPREDGGISFAVEPTLPALDVIAAFDFEDTFAALTDPRIDMLIVQVPAIDGTHEFPKIGAWTAYLHLSEWTIRRDLSHFDARFPIEPKDAITSIYLEAPK